MLRQQSIGVASMWLRCALHEIEKGVVEATEGQQCDDDAERRRNELRKKDELADGCGCSGQQDRMQRWEPEHD